MKQPKQKTQPVMSARKAAKSELKARLLTTLKNVLEQDKIKLTKKIKKQSKKLLKAVADELVIAKPAVVKTKKPAKATGAPKVAKPAKAAVAPKAAKDVKAKPAPKVVDAKAKPEASAKKTAPKETTVKASAVKPVAKSKSEKK